MSLASLRGEGLTFSHQAKVILDSIDLVVSPGWHIGLVGPNGAGKTTLLRLLAGQLHPEKGTVRATPPAATVGYLPQERERHVNETVRALVARRTGVAEAEATMTAATTAMAAGEVNAGDEYAEALDRWLNLGGADLDARLDEIWANLGLATRLLDQPTTTLSGGEAARAGLATLLASRYDIYLLDEPTNDLDLDGLARLETWFTGLTAGAIVVSHDREFLRRTVTHVAELDEHSHQIALYAGGWDAYREEQATAARHARERYDTFSTKRDSLKSRSQREREWASQGLSKAKKKPADNDKNIRAFKINQTEQLAGRAARTERAMERLEVVDKPWEGWDLRLAIAEAPRSGAVTAQLTDAVVEQGDFRLGPVSLTIGYGERVAILGANGSGKTTLLGALLGRLPLDAGEVYVGPGVVVGEIEQARSQLADDRPLTQAFQDATGFTVAEARTLLAKFGLGADHVSRTARSLSPGERTRAVLALLMAVGTNCLLLDEPTNHLDLVAIEQLEIALTTFAGTVLLVTHDRQLLDAVALSRTVRLEAGRIISDESV